MRTSETCPVCLGYPNLGTARQCVRCRGTGVVPFEYPVDENAVDGQLNLFDPTDYVDPVRLIWAQIDKLRRDLELGLPLPMGYFAGRESFTNPGYERKHPHRDPWELKVETVSVREGIL